MESPLSSYPGIDAHLARINERLLDSVVTNDPMLDEITTHLIRAGGKRLRPLFAVLSAATTTDVNDDIVDGGVCVELVQVGSLYHDDVIDESTTRRGVESVNVRWNNLTAILAGDFLLARASEIAARLGTEVAGLLGATIARLCEGELLELRHAYDTTRSEEAYFGAIEGKTASLYATACRIGGIVGGLPRPAIDALTEFGRCYGMAFQLVDDVLDIVATDEQLGKPAGLDLTEGIYNLPVLRSLADPEVGAELRSLLGTPIDGEPRDRARTLTAAGGGVAASLDEARSFVARGQEILAAGVPESVASATLAALASHLVDSAAAVAA